MISVWRIDKARRSPEESFSGEGAALQGGRWNQPGTRMVYASGSLSLAAMEKFVHMGDEGRGIKLVSYQIDIPAGLVDELMPEDLPSDWKALAAPRSTMEVGTQWTTAASSPVLKVPSVIIETEHNYLINSVHPDFKRLKISLPKPFQLDPRMWKK